ncbi:Amine oxidase [Neofusicoccum parvum]|uniref:Amine oxidase n=2 Tax=Neofusicoccum parvum TaxID=310453 RepID=A0ACB5RP19_9PEZI|nr:putative l-amino acid oxidase protein [Neofusicoccum parvum UCRNP2]GME22263.1 Amine oxidase [Neofusicoccum parvum]GME49007.1 Amine oxidase [Neofusicoccum parvum]
MGLLQSAGLLSGTFAAALLAGNAAASAIPRSTTVVFNGPYVAEADGMTNIHISFAAPVDGELSIHYGSCDMGSPFEAHHRVGRTHVGDHPLAKRNLGWEDYRPSRFVWLPPANIQSGGCLHAFSGDELVGRSDPYTVTRRKARRSTSFADIADPMGPWFDGVEYLKEKEPDATFVAQSKSKSVGILGGGMSGLMSAHLLESVGISDWKIIEATNRIGGRVHTSYLNGSAPEDYQYQEMGPMRFPVSLTNTTTNDTIQIMDHRMVFQLADTLNEMNGHDPSWSVDFIKWIQKSANDPTDTTDTAASYSNETAVESALEAIDEWDALTWEKMRDIATNVFEAHKKAVAEGYFDFSEAGYLRYMLKTDLNITDQAVSTASDNPEWLYDSVYFSATEWRTIDKGLSRLPKAFTPLVSNRTIFGTKVEELSFDESTEKMTVSWRPDGPFSDSMDSLEFDYTIVAVPFSKVRMWKLPSYTGLLSRAIQTLNYEQSCKVALHYETRFWEHLSPPIIGGCGSTNITGIGSICYPSYQINGTGPGVILASYESGTLARSLGSMPEAEHVAYVQRAMVAVHGQAAADQWTGNYDRICWENNEYQSGAWASPLVGQQELYLPAYYHTEKHTVFVGEHTSFTHAWIFSALESAVRGTTQLLLDMGLVDEAKQVTETWMARWIHV